MVYIYILSLECNKYYVGRTTNIKYRLKKHYQQRGSYWTTKYKFVNIYQIYENCDVFDEDKYTIEMMAKYGIDNVRGGSFSKITLSKEEINVINSMINNANDKCFNCHSDDHYIYQCPYDKIHNRIFMNLLGKIINNCKDFNNNNNNNTDNNNTDNNNTDNKEIDILTLKDILFESDNVIFNNITLEDIKHHCVKINKQKFNGIEYIDYNDGKINYISYAIGLMILLDRNT